MVKFSTPVVLLAVAVAGALAQSPSPSPSQPPSGGNDGGNGGGNGGGNDGGKGGGDDKQDSPSSPVCSALFGKNSQVDCQYSSTTVPPYNLPSLVNFFIGQYTPGAQGRGVSEVADDLAGSVVKYYPTVTASSSDIRNAMYKGIVNSIRSQGQPDFKPSDKIDLPDSGAVSKYGVPVAAAAVAMVAGGAVLL